MPRVSKQAQDAADRRNLVARFDDVYPACWAELAYAVDDFENAEATLCLIADLTLIRRRKALNDPQCVEWSKVAIPVLKRISSKLDIKQDLSIQRLINLIEAVQHADETRDAVIKSIAKQCQRHFLSAASSKEHAFNASLWQSVAGYAETQTLQFLRDNLVRLLKPTKMISLNHMPTEILGSIVVFASTFRDDEIAFGKHDELPSKLEKSVSTLRSLSHVNRNLRALALPFLFEGLVLMDLPDSAVKKFAAIAPHVGRYIKVFAVELPQPKNNRQTVEEGRMALSRSKMVATIARQLINVEHFRLSFFPELHCPEFLTAASDILSKTVTRLNLCAHYGRPSTMGLFSDLLSRFDNLRYLRIHQGAPIDNLEDDIVLFGEQLMDEQRRAEIMGAVLGDLFQALAKNTRLHALTIQSCNFFHFWPLDVLALRIHYNDPSSTFENCLELIDPIRNDAGMMQDSTIFYIQQSFSPFCNSLHHLALQSQTVTLHFISQFCAMLPNLNSLCLDDTPISYHPVDIDNIPNYPEPIFRNKSLIHLKLANFDTTDIDGLWFDFSAYFRNTKIYALYVSNIALRHPRSFTSETMVSPAEVRIYQYLKAIRHTAVTCPCCGLKGIQDILDEGSVRTFCDGTDEDWEKYLEMLVRSGIIPQTDGVFACVRTEVLDCTRSDSGLQYALRSQVVNDNRKSNQATLDGRPGLVSAAAAPIIPSARVEPPTESVDRMDIEEDDDSDDEPVDLAKRTALLRQYGLIP